MPDLRDYLTQGSDNKMAGGHRGIIAKNAAEMNDPVLVILQDFDEVETWGPMRWQARDDISLPAKGDACLVVFDNAMIPWVVAWWPF